MNKVKEVILCTNKQIPEDKLELNEIQTKEGFVCLVPIEEEEVINVNIHMMKTKGEERPVKEREKRLVNLDIGESRVLSEIDLYDEYYTDNPYEKNVLIKTKGGDISYSIENPVRLKLFRDVYNNLNRTVTSGRLERRFS